LSALSLAALVAAWLLAQNFHAVFPKTPPALADDVRLCLPLLAVGLWLQFISSVLGNLLAAKEANYLANQFNLLVLAVRAALTVWALLSGHGLSALVLVTISASSLGLVL